MGSLCAVFAPGSAYGMSREAYSAEKKAETYLDIDVVPEEYDTTQDNEDTKVINYTKAHRKNRQTDGF